MHSKQSAPSLESTRVENVRKLIRYQASGGRWCGGGDGDGDGAGNPKKRVPSGQGGMRNDLHLRECGSPLSHCERVRE